MCLPRALKHSQSFVPKSLTTHWPRMLQSNLLLDSPRAHRVGQNRFHTRDPRSGSPQQLEGVQLFVGITRDHRSKQHLLV